MTYLAINLCMLEWWHIALALLLPFLLGYLLAYGIWSRYKKIKEDLEEDIKDLNLKIQELEEELDKCKHIRVDLESDVALLKGQLREKKLEITTLEASLAANQEKMKPPSEKIIPAATGIIASGLASDAPVDDLKKVEGIGPKIEDILNGQSIRTFRALSETSVERLKAILEDAGPRYRIANPETWPEQAALAAAGKWEELKALQDNLKGGRR